MKLRIKGNTIRFRLTKTEVETFGREGHMKETVRFGTGTDQHFHYEIATGDNLEDTTIDYLNHTIRVLVPATVALQWVNSDQVGFEQEVNTGNDRVHVLVEKDFQCLHRDDAEEPDNYAHPMAK